MNHSFVPTTPHSTQDTSRELASPSHVATEHPRPVGDHPLTGPNGEQVLVVLPEPVKLESEPPEERPKRR
jgi:hypothetical protein